MIDIKAEAEKSLGDVKCKAVFQYPKILIICRL